MQPQQIRASQTFCILSLFLTGTIFFNLPHSAKQDNWILVGIAALAMLPILCIYLRILSLHPGKDLFDILYERTGKIAGFCITLLYILFVLSISALAIRNYVEVVHTLILLVTPPAVVTLFFGMVCIYLCKKGMVTLNRLGIFYLIIMAVVWYCSFYPALTNFHASNLLPVLTQPVGTLADNVFSLLTYPFGDLVILLGILPHMTGGQGHKKAIFLSYAFTSVNIILFSLRNILILGGEVYSDFYFPGMLSSSIMRVGSFVQRIEALLLGLTLLVAITKVCICLFVIGKGITKLFGIGNETSFVAPVALLACALSLILFHHPAEMMVFGTLFRWFALPFQVIIPVLLWIVAEWAIRRKKRKEKLI